jgi:hypothetical protein
MVILFSTACCGVTEEDKIWACPDGETLEVSEQLGAELIRVGYGVAVVAKHEPKPRAKAKGE